MKIERPSVIESCIGRLLVVDDDLHLLNALCDTLADKGYQSVGFNDSHEALEALKQESFDLVLTDLKMPEMDGITLMKKALEIEPLAVVIIMTGQGSIETAVEAMKTGAFDYFLKPFQLKNVLPVLSRAMAIRRLKSENIELRESLAIYELSMTVAFSLTEDTILNKMADAAVQAFNADELSIMLPTKDGREFSVAVARGENRNHIVGSRAPIDKGVASWVAKRKEPLILQGEINDRRFSPLRPRSDIRSSVCMPILMGGKFLGVLNLNAIRRRPITPGEVKSLSILVSIGAAAIENARLHEQVSEAQERYRSIFDNAAEGIFQTTRDGRFLNANPALARMLGFESTEDLISGTADIGEDIYLKPEHRLEHLRLLEEKGTVHNFEFQVRRKDGRVVWVAENARVVKDSTGNVSWYEGLLQDITERKESEQALARSESKYRDLVEGLQEGIWVIDKDSYTTFVNTSMAEMLGYTVEEMQGKHLFSFMDEKEVKNARLKMDRRRQGIKERHDFEFLRKDGKEMYASLETAPLYDDEGNYAGAIAGVMDITERRMLEQELRRNEKRFRLHFENVWDVIFSLDREFRITDISPSVERVLGYRPEELVGRRFPELGLLAPKDLDRALDATMRQLAGEAVEAQTYAFISKAGDTVYGEINSSLLWDDNEVVGIISSARDVTQRRLAEVLIEKQKVVLEALNRVLRKTLVSETEAEVARTCLEEAERLTGSEFGWVGRITESGRFSTIAQSDASWAACQMPDAAKEAASKDMEITGYWGRTIREKQSQIVNDPAADPDRRGTPDGHPPITAFMGVPLKRGDQTFGMIGLANKASGYRADDEFAIEQVAGAFVQSLDRIEAQQKVKEYSRNLEEMVRNRTEELRRVLQEVRDTRDHLDSVLQSVADGLVVTNHEGKVTLMNPAAERLLRLKSEQAFGQHLYIAVEDKTLKDRIRVALTERDPGYQFDFEVSGEKEQPARILRARTAKMLAKWRDHEGMVMVISDVTLEREVDRMKTEFLSSAAHELRTPLTSIRGFSEILMTRDNLSPVEREKFLSYVNAQAVTLGNIINDLLDISRIESGRGFSLNRTVFDMGKLVQDVTEMCIARTAKHRFELTLLRRPLEVNADRDKMEQVLDNILSNAMKYSPKGGSIQVNARMVDRESAVDRPRKEKSAGEAGFKRPCLEVSVSDEGIGMTSEQLEKVFDKFWRADASNKAIEGTGLGMSIVKYIVEAHCGQVWVESEYGKGTKVTFTVPEK